MRKLNFENIAQGHPNATSAFFLMQKFTSKDDITIVVHLSKKPSKNVFIK